jgi:hypothetical protein
VSRATPSNQPTSARDTAERLAIDLSPSRLATIDAARLDDVAGRVALFAKQRRPSAAAWSDPEFWNVEGTRRDRVQFVAVGNSINFRFWRLRGGVAFPSVGRIGGREFRGSMFMWRSLRRALDAGRYPILDAAFLSRISPSEFDAIFRDDTGALPLSVGRRERIANLRDFGQRLVDRWGGDFARLVDSASHSLVTFARSSAEFRAWDDPVCKLAMVNAIMISGSGLCDFREDPLPGIDYHLVKQLVRQGVVQPSPVIAQKLTLSRLLTRHEAYELRRVSMAALVQMEFLSRVKGPLLDNLYWFNRMNCRELDPVCLDATKAHLCPFVDACEQLVAFRQPFEITRYY